MNDDYIHSKILSFSNCLYCCLLYSGRIKRIHFLIVSTEWKAVSGTACRIWVSVSAVSGTASRKRVLQAEEDYSRLNMKASNKILLGCNYLKNKPILKINTKIIIIINRKKNGYFLTNSGLPDVIYFIYLTNLSNLSYIFESIFFLFCMLHIFHCYCCLLYTSDAADE